MLRINLESATTTIAAALPMLRARRRGRIAIVGSLAALQPLADAPAYSASKAGLMRLRGGAEGVAYSRWRAVTLIYPGHIATNQVSNHVGALPLIMSADDAAARMSAARSRPSLIAFPLALFWLIRAGRMLPWRVRASLGASMRFHVDKE